MYRIKIYYLEEDKGPLMMSLPSLVVHNSSPLEMHSCMCYVFPKYVHIKCVEDAKI